MRIFLAGAAGAIGRRLVPLLLAAGHHVVGTTRSTSKADLLRAAGVEPVVLDIFDSAPLTRAVSAARPDIVIHQLTDLPPGLDPGQMAEGTRRNARMRSEGTRSLVSAALASGARRLIAQSIAWMYAGIATTLRRGSARYRRAGRACDHRGRRRGSGAARHFVAAD